MPAIDAYIANAQPFAQPILRELRESVHRAAPEADEAIKWSMPFFTVNGVILANMAAFKQHCSFGVWSDDVAAVRRETGAPQPGNTMGSFGRIESVADLPARKTLEKLIRDAAALILEGKRTRNWAGRRPRERPAEELHPALQKALAGNKTAARNFASMSPSAQREYGEWIAEAKREETREKRLQQAIEWIAEGKQRNWKYQTAASKASA